MKTGFPVKHISKQRITYQLETMAGPLITPSWIEQLWQGKNYKVWGLPFYNETQRKAPFEQAFEELTAEK